MKKTSLQMAVVAALAGYTATGTQVAWSQQAGGLEEIVVTATRREQNLQQVPVSIVAITGDNLELQGLDSLEDVGNNVPNINIQGGGAGTYGPAFTVRGLPNVGLYVDGVWQVGTNGFLTSDFVDVDRIEVLRGPQGTTYGRDAVGGAIRIWTRKPGDEFGGTITATTGSYDRRDIKMAIDVPFSENFKTKWTAASLYRDGFIQGLALNQDFGESDQEVYRGDILWTPSDRVSIRASFSQDDLIMNEPRIQDAVFDTAYIPGPGGGAPAVQNWGVIPAQFYGLAIEGAIARGAGASVAGLDAYTAQNFVAGYPGGKVGKWENRSNASLPTHIQHEQTTIDINWEVTDSIGVQFLTAYTEQVSDVNIDWENADYTLVEDFGRDRLDLFSEEIQISGGGDRISWVGGIYYWDQKQKNRSTRYLLDEFNTLAGDPGPQLLLSDVFASQRCANLRNPATNPNNLLPCEVVAGILPFFTFDNLTQTLQDGWATFGEVTVGLTDRMDLTFGLRHHDQTNSVQPMAFIPGVTAPRPRTGNTLHTGGDPFAGTLVGSPTVVQFDENTIKAALQMQFSDDVMGYVSYSEGFDSGGISSTDTSQGLVFFPYDPQIIENTEVGLRADLLDGKLRVNATVFSSDWLNIQNAGVVRDPGTGAELPQLVTTNVGTANASGVELELTVVPTESLMLNFSLGLLDTGYTQIAAGTFSLDTSTEFAQAPDTTYNIGIQHVADLENGGSFTTRFDYAYTSQFWRSLPFLRQDWYGAKNGGPVPANNDESGDWGTVSARVMYQPASGEYTLSVFGTNLTNEYMLNSGFFHGIWGFDFATVSRPREFGASLQFRF